MQSSDFYDLKGEKLIPFHSDRRALWRPQGK